MLGIEDTEWIGINGNDGGGAENSPGFFILFLLIDLTQIRIIWKEEPPLRKYLFLIA